MPPTCHEVLPGDNIRLAQAAGLIPAPIRGSYRTADGRAMIEWELEPKENGLEFSASGEMTGHGCGQCLDEIASAYPDDAQVQRVVRVWREWHLNGMNAGTPEQTACLDAREKKYPDDLNNAPYNGDHYKWAVGVLKAAGLYRVRIPAGTSLRMTGGFDLLPKSDYEAAGAGWFYNYGQGWIFNPLPAEIVAEVRSWSEFGRKNSKSLGDCQAEEFLERHGIKARITLSNSKPAPWVPAGNHYRVTLYAGVSLTYDNPLRRLVFDFWGSAHDADEHKHPSIYQILSCIGSDIHTPDTFEDYCAEYGESADSLKALQTFRKCARFARRMREFFTESERKELAEIR